MVNAVPEFTDQPKVINGCSDLFVAVLGERGRHARSAVGMGSLPMQITVEIEAVMRIHESTELPVLGRERGLTVLRQVALLQVEGLASTRVPTPR